MSVQFDPPLTDAQKKARVKALAERVRDDKPFRETIKNPDNMEEELVKAGYSFTEEEISFMRGYLIAHKDITEAQLRNKIKKSINDAPGW